MLHLNKNTIQEPYIIIVDNDFDDCVLILDCLKHLNWHHHVKIVNDADTMLEILDTTPDSKLLPTLIVLDYNLPRLGGETTLMLLKKDERFKHIPVAVYSTSMNNRIEKQLLTLGANNCYKKPLTIDGMHWLLVEFNELAHSFQQNSKPKESISER